VASTLATNTGPNKMKGKTKSIKLVIPLYRHIENQFVTTPKYRGDIIQWAIRDKVERKIPRLTIWQEQSIKIRLVKFFENS
jgi:hypothetical protein